MARFADPVKGTGLTHYCNRCRSVCSASATATRSSGMGSPWGALTPFVKPTSAGTTSPRRLVLSGEPTAAPTTRRSPFDELIADLQRAAGSSAASPSPAARRGAFDELTESLRRDAARMQTQRRATPASPATVDEDVALLMIDETGVRRIRRSPLERLADELREASRPPATLPTREEVRARMKELDRVRAEREHRRRLAEIRAYAAARREFNATAAELEASCR